MSREYREVNPETVLYADPGAIGTKPDWATENDGSDIFSMRTDNYGRCYIVGPLGDIYVDFDADNDIDIERASAWVATFFRSNKEN